MTRPSKFSGTFVLFSLLLAPFAVRAQSNGSDVYATGSNLLRFGTGTTQLAPGYSTDKQYLEEIADARIFFDNFELGLRYELDDPSELGRNYPATLGEDQSPEFRRRWLAYKKDDVDVQAGDVSALFGRGLGINLFESRPLNYDSWLDGVFGRGEYKIPTDILPLDASVKVQGIGGQETFFPIDTTVGNLPMNISARAADAEFGFWKKKLVLGAEFLQAFTGTSQLIFTTPEATNRQVNQPAFYGDYNSGPFEWFLEWTQNRTQVSELTGIPVDTSHTGRATYTALSYSNAFFGLTFDYKNYAYYIHDPNQTTFLNVFSKLPISSPPEVYKDFTWTEITRTTHAVNFDDELGYQLEANITAIPEWVIDLDGAASSTHNEYDAQSNVIGSTSILPKLSDLGYYPFWEFYGEGEYDFDPENTENFIKFAAHHRSDVIAYTAGTSSEYRWSTTIATKFQYETTPSESLLAIWEHQWAYDPSNYTDGDNRRLNELVTLQYSFNPTINFGATFDYAFYYMDEPIKVDNATFGGWDLHLWGNAVLNHLPEFYTALRLGQSHQMILSYGAERGGLNCTGGICRIVPPFNGLRLSLTSQI